MHICTWQPRDHTVAKCLVVGDGAARSSPHSHHRIHHRRGTSFPATATVVVAAASAATTTTTTCTRRGIFRGPRSILGRLRQRHRHRPVWPIARVSVEEIIFCRTKIGSAFERQPLRLESPCPWCPAIRGGSISSRSLP
jgi:hypothetical protein